MIRRTPARVANDRHHTRVEGFDVLVLDGNYRQSMRVTHNLGRAGLRVAVGEAAREYSPCIPAIPIPVLRTQCSLPWLRLGSCGLCERDARVHSRESDPRSPADRGRERQRAKRAARDFSALGTVAGHRSGRCLGDSQRQGPHPPAWRANSASIIRGRSRLATLLICEPRQPYSGSQWYSSPSHRGRANRKPGCRRRGSGRNRSAGCEPGSSSRVACAPGPGIRRRSTGGGHPHDCRRRSDRELRAYGAPDHAATGGRVDIAGKHCGASGHPGLGHPTG